MTFKNRWLTLSIVLTSSLIATAAAAASFTMKTVTVSKNTLRGEENFVETKVKPLGLPLQRFAFEFENNDHKVKSLGVWAANEKVNVVFADGNDDDPYAFNAGWTTIPTKWLSTSSRLEVTSTQCKGSCTLPIALDSGSTTKRVLISGFKFSRFSERNIQRISIRPNLADKRFEVTFKDGGNPNDNPFTVQIIYNVVTAARCLHYKSASGNKKAGEQSIEMKAEEGLKAIAGFDVKFSKGDHHLKRFGIAPGGTGFSVRMNDRNHDDEVSAIIDYCVLDEAGAKAGN